MLKRLGIVWLLAAPLMAFQSGWLGNSSIQFKANYYDNYLFRGRQFSDEAINQFGMGFGMGSWNYALLHSELKSGSGPFSQENAHEISVTTLSNVGVTTFGYLFLDYDGTQADTQELFVRYSRESAWHPVVGMDYDFDTYKGYHLDYSLTRHFPLSRQGGLLFQLKGDLAYDLAPEKNDAGEAITPGFYSKNGLVHYQAGLKYVWQARRWLKFEANYDYHWMKDALLRAALSGKDHQAVTGASLTLTFP